MSKLIVGQLTQCLLLNTSIYLMKMEVIMNQLILLFQMELHQLDKVNLLEIKQLRIFIYQIV